MVQFLSSERMGWQTFSVNGRGIYISLCDRLGFCHTFLISSSFFFKQHFKNAKINLSLWAAQKVMAGRIWPTAVVCQLMP